MNTPETTPPQFQPTPRRDQKGKHQREIAELKGSEQFYSAIGRFVAEFSQLEALLKWVIEDAVRLPEEYAGVIMTHDFAMLCTIAQNVLSRNIDETVKEKLGTVIGKCRDLNNHRVRIVHGFWRISSKTGSLVHRSRQKLESSTFYRFNAGEVAAQADTATELWDDLIQFWHP